MKRQGYSSHNYREERAKERYYEQNTISKLIGKKVKCVDKPDLIGIITFKNQYTDELDIQYPNGEKIIAHISRCSCKGIEQ